MKNRYANASPKQGEGYTAAHTPGPWDFVTGRTLHHVETQIDNPIGAGIHICSVDLKRMADARLIAAAPDLLAAAHETVSSLTDHYSLMGADDDYIYDELGSGLAAAFFSARAAIAKATGRANGGQS